MLHVAAGAAEGASRADGAAGRINRETVKDAFASTGQSTEGIGDASAVIVGIIVFGLDTMATIPILGTFIDIGTAFFIFFWVHFIEGIHEGAMIKRFILRKLIPATLIDVFIDFLGITFFPVQTIVWIWIVIDSRFSAAKRITKTLESMVRKQYTWSAIARGSLK